MMAPSFPPSFPDDTILMAYADQELEPGLLQAVEAAIAADPSVRDRVAMFALSAKYLRDAFFERDFAAPPAGLEQKIRRAARWDRTRAVVRRALPMAAMIGGLAIGVTQLPRLTAWWDNGAAARTEAAQIDGVLQEVAEYHAVFVRETEHLVEVPATRQAHIEEWLGNRVDFPLHVPDLSARGLIFVGARMLVVNARPVAQLMYTTARGEHVALCVTRRDQIGVTELRHLSDQGFDLYAQGSGKHLFVVAAPAGVAVARTLALEVADLFRRG